MPDQRFAIIDPAAGISGDMLLGSLIAAGAPPEWLQALPARLGCPEVTVDVRRVYRCGVLAVKVDVRLPGGRQEQPSEVVASPGGGHEHHHPHDHSHPHSHSGGDGHRHDHHHHGHRHAGDHHEHGGDEHGTRAGEGSGGGSGHSHGHGSHRHIGELIGMIERADLSSWVRERAIRAFRLLGEAEGRVHGLAADDVPLHEVGAFDALIDIVGGIEGFERLNIERVHHRPVALGSGWVRSEHGVMPVPAPATAILLEGVEVAPNGPVEGEATTPTGAVLLRVLSSGAPPASWRMVGSGWGAGGRNPGHYPNALRLIVAESAAEAGEVVLLSTDIDDLSPEYLAPLRDALFAAGALDVQLWTTHMKKGRVGFRIEVTAAAAEADRVIQALFRHSTTAGIRRQVAERLTLPRRQLEVVTPDGTVRVKVLEGPDGPKVKPEYDDVAALARRTGRPAQEVAQEIHDRAMRLL